MDEILRIRSELVGLATLLWGCNAIGKPMFLGAHAVTLDSQDSLYIDEVAVGYPNTDRGANTLLKLRPRTRKCASFF